MTKERRSWLMSRIRGKDTAPELTLRKVLYSLGVRGWRVHVSALPGKPDLAFGRWKVAVFVDGAFWHGHPSKFTPGRLSPEWEAKILGNQQRDRRADAQLRRMGWSVIRVWDRDLKKDAVAQAEKVVRALGRRGYVSPNGVGTPPGPPASTPRAARADSASRTRSRVPPPAARTRTARSSRQP